MVLPRLQSWGETQGRSAGSSWGHLVSVPVAAPHGLSHLTQPIPAPGVGKGTYASRVAERVGIPHIAMGDLVRDEIKSGSAKGKEMSDLVKSGRLVPDKAIVDLLLARLDHGKRRGEKGFLLDGFPRTRHQAELLSKVTKVDLALNMALAEEILVEKCLGRRMCGKCGRNFNVANIYLPATATRPEIKMPPLNPPKRCSAAMPFFDSATFFLRQYALTAASTPRTACRSSSSEMMTVRM